MESMFNTLENSAENRKRRRTAFCCGLALQAGLISMAVLFALLFPEELPKGAGKYVVVFVPSLTPRPVVKPKPVPQVPRVVIAKLQPPVTPPKLADPPLPVMPKIEPPKVRPTPPPLTIAVNVPAPPPEPTFTRATAPAPKPQVEVHTGTFGATPEAVTTRRPAAQVQTGGFGSPEGFKGQAKGESAGNVPVLGSFGLPDGPGKGNGTGGKHGVQGVVASAGFGSGAAAGSGAGRGGNQTVAMGGFQTVAQVSNAPAKNIPVAAPVDFQPVEVLSKPSPVYTEEARRLGIQGDVVLSVVFQADGHLQINGVVRPLGHGLEQSAEQAAARIRFKPAQHDGKPVDFPANLRIEFRLADQST